MTTAMQAMKPTLEDLCDRRLTLTGTFESYGNKVGRKQRLTALFRECRVTADVDGLEAMDLQEGDRIECLVLVGPYMKDGKKTFGLRDQTDAHRVSRPVAVRIGSNGHPNGKCTGLPPPPPRSPPPATTPPPVPEPPAQPPARRPSLVEGIRKVKALAAELGGAERLREMIEAIEELGAGAEHK